MCFTLLVGLIFAGGGVMIFSETAWPTWRDWRVMQRWKRGRYPLMSGKMGSKFGLTVKTIFKIH